MELYNLLGVTENATTDEIKKAYRQLALKYHPDRNPGDVKSEAFFKKITEAYEILSDPEQRESYNRKLKQTQQSQDIQSNYRNQENNSSKKYKIWDSIAKINFKLLFVILFIGLALFIGISNELNNDNSNEKAAINNGDLDSSFTNSNSDTSDNIPDEILVEKEREKLIAEGWSEEDLSNGQLPICYNFKPLKGKYDNYLEVQVGSGTDVVIKVMNSKTEKCVRYVFINAGTTYKIKNIPQGTYYLKLAYGKDWFSKVENGQCIGKFLRNAFYEKGDEIIDFNIKDEGESYSVPSFKLKLDVISRSPVNTFSSEKISEEYFNQ